MPAVEIAITPWTAAVKDIVGAAIPEVTVIKCGIDDRGCVSRLHTSSTGTFKRVHGNMKNGVGAAVAIIAETAELRYTFKLAAKSARR